MFGLLMPKNIFRYSIMPEVGSRLRDLFMSGFHYIPFFIAVVYQMVGLLPRQHPYLQQSNMGRYGVRHVVFEAARNIRFTLRNIDQIILFLAVLIGLVIFLIQILSLGALAFFQPAMASIPVSWAGFFVIENVGYRSQDLAFMMLDMVFGVPYPGGGPLGFFESCIGSPVPCRNNFGDNIPNIDLGLTTVSPSTTAQFGPLATDAHTFFPFPYHLGIHRLFSIYSNGLLVIAVMITCYFIATILAETAQSGTPFGKRFNKTWAPLRLVIAFGLLIPLNAGLNSSQYLVLYAAKYGSAFATNGWTMFNETLTNGYLGDPKNLITVPNTPELGYLTQFGYVAKTCKVAHEFYALKALRIKEKNPSLTALPPEQEVRMYALGPHSEAPLNALEITESTDYTTLLTFLNPGVDAVTIRFGVKNPDQYTEYHSFINPVCGEVQLTLQDSRDQTDAAPGPYWIQFIYFSILSQLWHDAAWLVGIGGAGEFAAVATATSNHRHIEVANRRIKGLNIPGHDVKLDATYINNVNKAADESLEAYTQLVAVTLQANSARLTDQVLSDLPALYSKGWAAAGIWYNRVAEMNGSLIAAAYAVPIISKYPAIMRKVASIKEKYDKEVDEKERFKPTAAGAGDISLLLDKATGQEFAGTLYEAYYTWSSGGLTKETLTGNGFLDGISTVLGLNGLYDLRRNPDAHPLAMLVGVGRALVESAVTSLGYAVMSSVLSAANIGGAFGQISGSFFVSIAMIGLTVGFVLFYVVPFLPFIYFFFAVGGWIKGIFEAMVGAPLWALAHIRIDGDGLPGKAAINGYFLIFEVFLRPILTIFGLLASISIFAALIDVLNSVFSLVTENIAGYDIEQELSGSAVGSTTRFIRSRIDEFFFTVIYAILVYMIGMSSFKLIDTIPNNILRWMGQSVAAFGDQSENPTEGLVSKTTLGSQQALSKIGGGLQAAVRSTA